MIKNELISKAVKYEFGSIFTADGGALKRTLMYHMGLQFSGKDRNTMMPVKTRKSIYQEEN